MDTDTFLATVAGVSGTVAAILGGFVLSVLLTQRTESSRLRSRCQEILATIQRLSAELAAKQEQHDAVLRTQLTAWLRLVYRFRESSPSVDEVQRRVTGLGLGLDEQFLQDVVRRYVAMRSAADEAADRDYEDLLGDRKLRSFSQWLHKNEGIADIDLMADAYWRVIGSVERFEDLGTPNHLIRARAEHFESTGSDDLASADQALRNWQSSVLPVSVAELERLREQNLADYREVVAQLEPGELQSRVGFGFTVFCVMVVVGVAYPIWLMPAPKSVAVIEILSVKIGLFLQILLIGLYVSTLLWARRASRPTNIAYAAPLVPDEFHGHHASMGSTPLVSARE